MFWYKKVISNYVGFSGRARRKEYWMFALINFLIATALSILGRLIDIENILSSIYSLFVLLPGLAVAFRRLHDTGKTGAWVLIALIPIIGWIILIVFMCQDSDQNENKHGPNPKAIY
ncbi:DUF805 domain-containing protein [Virgibacillus flavescens]|uniref:DUF805 domain-containing protein n=1 Tax=Virgibacillus flavescens TaxID=1611422 RepID=UPI003D3452F3